MWYSFETLFSIETDWINKIYLYEIKLVNIYIIKNIKILIIKNI